MKIKRIIIAALCLSLVFGAVVQAETSKTHDYDISEGQDSDGKTVEIIEVDPTTPAEGGEDGTTVYDEIIDVPGHEDEDVSVDIDVPEEDTDSITVYVDGKKIKVKSEKGYIVVPIRHHHRITITKKKHETSPKTGQSMDTFLMIDGLLIAFAFAGACICFRKRER